MYLHTSLKTKIHVQFSPSALAKGIYLGLFVAQFSSSGTHHTSHMQLLPTQCMDIHTILLSQSHNWHWSPINFPALMSTILQTVMPSSVDQSEQHELNLICHVEWLLWLSTFCQIPRLCDNRPLILSAAIAGIGNTCFLIPIAFLFQQESLLLVHSYTYIFYFIFFN